MIDDAPILRRKGMPATVLAAIVTEPETIASLAYELGVEYSIVKSVVYRLRSRGLVKRSKGYRQPLVATIEGRRAIFALYPRSQNSRKTFARGTMRAKMDQK